MKSTPITVTIIPISLSFALDLLASADADPCSFLTFEVRDFTSLKK